MNANNNRLWIGYSSAVPRYVTEMLWARSDPSSFPLYI